MTLEQFLHDAIETAKTLAAALAPAAIGSAVAQAWEQGLSLRDRLIQWAVGICVSYYMTQLAGAIFGFSEFVAQGVGFVVAMIAFKATPRFTASAGDAVARVPGALADAIVTWFPKKKGGDQ